MKYPDSQEEEDEEELDEEVRLREAAAKAAVKMQYDNRHHAAARDLQVGDAVFVQQPSGATDKATVLTSNQHEVTIKTEAGAVQRRHLDRFK